MRIELLKPRGNYPAGRVWDCPWDCLARALIEQGEARAVNPADPPLNPAPSVAVAAGDPKRGRGRRK